MSTPNLAQPLPPRSDPAAEKKNQQLAVFNNVRKHLEDRKGEFANVLPKHMTADRMMRIALTTIAQTPSLLECTAQSLAASVMTAAQLGLEPDGILGQAYIVPFNTKNKITKQWEKRAQLIPGYRGLLTLARNGGEVAEIYAHEVCKGDVFKFDIGCNELTHTYDLEKERGQIIGFYAVAHFTGGGKQCEVMSLPEVSGVRDKSQGYLNAKKYPKEDGTIDTPWVTHFAQMGRKTVIRRLVKYLPLNINKLRLAAAIEDMAEAGNLANITPTGDIELQLGSEIEGTATNITEGNDPKPTPTPTPTPAAAPATTAPAATGAPQAPRGNIENGLPRPPGSPPAAPAAAAVAPVPAAAQDGLNLSFAE